MAIPIDLLLVAGGGGGGTGFGAGAASGAGGGGGGGVLVVNVADLTTFGALPVVVGAGGAPAAKGGDSSALGFTAVGGGLGGSWVTGGAGTPGGNGGSGGGGSASTAAVMPGGTPTAGQGFVGGVGVSHPTNPPGGGGGGAAQAGGAATSTPAFTGGNGGNGLANSFSGASVVYGGGGGGGLWNSGTTNGTGGTGGGGAANLTNGVAGTPNTGGGGGGGGGTGAPGGSGIVILRYTTGTLIATGGTITTAGGFTIHTFTGSGTFTATAPNILVAGAAAIAVAAAANLSGATSLAAAATIRIAAAGNMAQGLNAAATIALATAAGLKVGAVRLATAFSITIGAAGRLGNPAALLAGAASFHVTTRSKIPTAHPGRVGITLDGVDVRARVNAVTIRDILNDAPNTCTLTIAPSTPPAPPRVNQRLRVVVENNDNNGLLFAGPLQTVTTSYEGRPNQLVYPCQAIDDTAAFNAKRPYGSWINTSASTVALALCQAFAPAFDTSRIVAGLPLVTITFDGSETMIGALARLAGMIGAYTKVEDMAVYLFQTDEADPPDPIDGAHCFLADPPIAMTDDVSQQRTRVYGRGHGESLLGDVVPGDTILPIADVIMFNPAGGKAVASVAPDGAVSERLTYTGIDLGGAGSLIGPGVQPSAGPTVARAIGAGLGDGTYRYAIVDVTAAGQTLPSPLSAPITTGLFPSPGGNIAIANDTQQYHTSDPANGWRVGDTVEWYYAYGDYDPNVAQIYPTYAGAPSGHVSIVAIQAEPPTQYSTSPGENAPCGMVLTYRHSADPTVTSIYVWFRIIGAPGHASVDWRVWNFTTNRIINVPAYAGVLSTYYYSTPNLYSPPLNAGPTNPSRNQIVLSDIALGAGATTARDLYRTAVNGTALKFLQRLANNTSTGPITDATPDASLGAAPPAADTSGLTTVVGQINAGSTQILTASAAPFSATGGWLTAPGNAPIRYTGKTGNTLTGIPASGSGSIVTTIQYGDPIVAAPALIGVSGLMKSLMAGARVCLFVQRDDLAAQNTYGIIEYLIVDERRAEASLVQLCDADLQRFARPLVTVAYATRDPKTRSGKSVVFNLASPPIADTLTIQDVTISEINVARGAQPRFSVSASSVRFSLEDILRQLAAAPEAT